MSKRSTGSNVTTKGQEGLPQIIPDLPLPPILAQLAAERPSETDELFANLKGVLTQTLLNQEQLWGIMLTVALTARNRPLAANLIAAGQPILVEALQTDARTAATLMATTNLYYSFKFNIGHEAYRSMHPRLKMRSLAQPKTTQINIELFALAASAANHCVPCMDNHEKKLRKLGVSEEQVHEAIRITAVVWGLSCALDAGPNPSAP